MRRVLGMALFAVGAYLALTMIDLALRVGAVSGGWFVAVGGGALMMGWGVCVACADVSTRKRRG